MILSVNDLHVQFKETHAVKGISFEVKPGETVGIVGGSGSGKSAAMLGLTGLIPASGKIELNRKHLGMIFQDPFSSLNPTMKIGRQVMDGMHCKNRETKALELLELVGIPDAFNKYPHELSGGQRQRAMIAGALACNPRLLIADEPTTALDVTTQKQILDLLKKMKDHFQMSLILISHDLKVISSMADRVLVMLDGQVVEQGTVDEVMQNPQHPYTQMLLGSREKMSSTSAALNKEPILQVTNLTKRYKTNVVDRVSFSIEKGETLGLVGESGCGKSTLSRMLVGLIPPTSGQIAFFGKRMQMIFQDPYGSLNPRMTVKQILDEPLTIQGLPSRADELLELVALPKECKDRLPKEFSGGQRQRIAIARALALNPDLLICDEALSALDASTQLQIIHLLQRLQKELGLTYLFIAHDLAMVRMISNRVAVMNEGKIVEMGSVEEIYSHPRHPFTKLLLNSF